MRRFSAMTAAAVVAAGSLLLTGCSVIDRQETAGQYIDGTAVTTQIKAKLANDPETSAVSIGVETMDGGVVQLSGFAKSQREKDRAGAIARSVKGVTAVHNNLIVRP